MKKPIPKIILLLRSVYLKGQSDANRKTSDVSWENKIVKDIQSYYLSKIPKKKEIIIKESPYKDFLYDKGYNQAIDDFHRAIKGE